MTFSDGEGKGRLGVFLFVIVFINTYLELPLGLGGASYIPSFFLLLSVFFGWVYLKDDVEKIDYSYVFWMFVFSIFSAFLAPNYSDLDSRLFGALQMATSSITFVVVLNLLQNFSRERLEQVFIWILRTLFVLTILEYLGVISGLSDAFRNSVYQAGGYVAYDGDVRDLTLGDSVRPKVFSSEPSLLAIGIFISAICASWARKSTRIALESIVIICIEYLMLNSPILLLVPVCLVAAFEFRKVFVWLVIVALAGAMFLISFGNAIDLGERLERFSPDVIFSTDTAVDVDNEKSERLRLVYPYISAVDSLGVNIISGLGVSGKRSLAIYSSISPLYEIAMGNNAFASIFIFFGLVGGALFIYGVTIFVKLKTGSGFNLGFALVVFCFMQTMGALESARFWAYLAMLVVVTRPFVAGKNIK